ncbi:MAG: glycoside hydrolase family 2 protein, partial [Actinobacteria bacterium]|nr:glycoside hydrolase family 2 protein [Actinomycetota bacterium]
MLRNVLNDGWSGALASDTPGEFAHFPATVPGGIFTDLLAAGLIPDPFDGDNEKKLHWVGDSDWSYSTTFAAPAVGVDRTDLVFHGLDTIARIVVNGRQVASTANMHRTYRIPVEGLLPEGNTLEVHFSAPRRVGAELRDRYGVRPVAFSDVSPFLRKMQCDFGWDWGPDLAPSGIWRDVVLESWSTARLASVRPIVSVDAADRGTVRFEVELERVCDAPVTVKASVGGVSVAQTVSAGVASVSL